MDSKSLQLALAGSKSNHGTQESEEVHTQVIPCGNLSDPGSNEELASESNPYIFYRS